MKKIKQILLTAGIIAGMAGLARAASTDPTAGYYNPPKFSTHSNTAIMRLTGSFEIRLGTRANEPGNNTTTYMVLSPTGGITMPNLPISVSTVTASTVTATQINFSTATGRSIAVSSLTLREIPYNPPAADGSSGQALTTNGAGQLSWSTISGGGVGIWNSTYYFTIPIGGEVVASSAVVPFFPASMFNGSGSTCTITEYWFETWQPSPASATFGMFAVAQSSWQFSSYGGPAITTGAVKSPVITGVAIVVKSTSTFSVGVASASVSAPAAEMSMKGRQWCGQPSGAP